jgi:TonB family protein
MVHLLIGRDGRVKSVKVIRSVAGLDEAATQAVSRWVFKPALSNNKPVAVWIEVSVPFPPTG